MWKGFFGYVQRTIEEFLLRIGRAILWLFKRHPVRVAIVGGLIVGALISGATYVDRVSKYQEIVASTVPAETEDTPQRYKVLEAFIMSTIDSNLTATLKRAPLSEQFFLQLQHLDRILASETSAPLSAAKPITTPVRRRDERLDGMRTIPTSASSRIVKTALQPRPSKQAPTAKRPAQKQKAAPAPSARPPQARDAKPNVGGNQNVIGEPVRLGVRLSLRDYSAANRDFAYSGILTDSADDGYLFFPVSLLRYSGRIDYKAAGTASLRNTDSDVLESAVRMDPVIADDIALSRKMLPVMRELTRTKLFNVSESRSEIEDRRTSTATTDALRILSKLHAQEEPSQVYYITKNGLNRIVNEADAKDQRTVYRNMFRATTFFPSRPYFVEAFKRIKSGAAEPLSAVLKGSTIDEAFYVSQPYLDIGGFGVVVTLARAVQYGTHSAAALCLDLPVLLKNEALFALRERLRTFGVVPHEVSCSVPFDGRARCSESAGVPYSLITDLEEKLTAAGRAGDLSTVVGNISVLGTRQPQEPEVRVASTSDLFAYALRLISGYASNPITFAYPKSSPTPVDKTLKAEFLIASLNLDRFAEITALIGLASVLAVASALFIMILSWQGEARTRHGYQEAFQKVDEVLYGAPTPYCRLNGRDEIVRCNTAFCELLGMSGDQQSVNELTGTTFESLLAKRSKATYHKVQQLRRASQEVTPYTVYFVRADGREVETRVTSGVVPDRLSTDLPETFGIAIEQPNVQARG